VLKINKYFSFLIKLNNNVSIINGNVHTHMAVFQEIWNTQYICVQNYQKML